MRFNEGVCFAIHLFNREKRLYSVRLLSSNNLVIG